ncbi:18779_t:CDS:2 [Entrophospora sp. SA101]|nr:18779_t:CDS:2 [Entrophospora sp. SA101]
MLHKHNSSNNLSIIAGGNDNNGETRPLLSSNLDKTNPKYSPTTTTTTKWYKRPSYHWILPSFFLLSVTFGLAVTTKINFYLKVICREYYSAGDGVHNVDYDDESCNTSEISALTSQLLLKLSLFHSIPAIVVLGSLGSLSDRRGRRIVLLLPTIGGICISSCIILVDKYLYGNPFGTKLLLFGSFLDGLTGSYTSLVAVSHAYVTDCTEPGKRNIVFGWLMGSLYCGFSIGPMIAGWISQATGNIISLMALKKVMDFLNIIKQLSIFLPASKNNRNNEESKVLGRYALLNSAIITFFTSFAIYGIQAVFLLYISLVFKLSVVEQGYLLFVIEEESEESKLRLKGELLKLEIWVIRIGLFIEAACMTLYGIISSGVALIGAAIASPICFNTLYSIFVTGSSPYFIWYFIGGMFYVGFFLTFAIRFTDGINNKNGEEGGIGYEISDGEYVDDDDINV